MPVTIKRSITVKDRTGRTIIVNQENAEFQTLVSVKDKGSNEEFFINSQEETVIEAESTVKCDGPTCDDGTGKPAQFSWTQEDAKQDPYAVPDGMYRVLTLTVGMSTVPKVFCCYDCLRRYMRDYVPPRSPREIKEEAENNLRVLKEQQSGNR